MFFKVCPISPGLLCLNTSAIEVRPPINDSLITFDGIQTGSIWGGNA
jgi:hypothetical protein